MTDPAFLLDANIFICLLAGDAPLLRARVEASEEGQLATSAIAFAEVMVGAARRDSVDVAMRFFRAIPVFPFDERAAEIYATLPFRRANVGRLIAAHALSLGLPLVTNNARDFADIPGLHVENWTR